MSRRRLTNKRNRRASMPPANPGYADYFETDPHPAAYPDPDPNDYENGDTSSWAEDPHPGPYLQTPHPATPWEGPANPETTKPDHFDGITPVETMGKKAFSFLKKKANKCLRIASHMLSKEASVFDIENQAIDLMDLPDNKVDNMLRNIQAGGFLMAEDDTDEEDEMYMSMDDSLDYLDDDLDDLYMAMDEMDAEDDEEDEEEMYMSMDDMYMSMDEDEDEEEMMLAEMLEEESMKHRMASRRQSDRVAQQLQAEIRQLRAEIQELRRASEDEEDDDDDDDEEEEMKRKARANDMLLAELLDEMDAEDDDDEMYMNMDDSLEEPSEEDMMLAEMLKEAEEKEEEEKEEKEEEEEEEESAPKQAHDLSDPMAWVDYVPQASDMGDLSALYSDKFSSDIDFSELEKEASSNIFASEDVEEEEEEEEEMGEAEGKNKKDKKANVRPQARKPSNGVSSLGFQARTAGEKNAVKELESLWESAPDLKDIF